MATLRIFNGQRLVEKTDFTGGLSIFCDNQIIYWHVGLEPCTDDQDTMSYLTTGAGRITDLMETSPGYFFQVINPDWILSINGQECPLGFYSIVDIYWSHMELQYRDYRFSFEFTAVDTDIQNDTPLPKPDRYRDDIPNVDETAPLG